MKLILGIIIVIIVGCTPGEPDVCELYYKILFKDKATSLCIKSKSNILGYYETDTIKVFQKNAFGNEKTFIEYIQDNDSCLFLKTNIVYPNDTIIIGNEKGKLDTIFIETNSENAKYYLNGQYQYEIINACRNIFVECIIEI